MYLVSIYFDDKTSKWIQGYINNVASKTGNGFMVDNNVPPHITIGAFEVVNNSFKNDKTEQIEKVIKVLDSISGQFERGKLTWVSVAAFFPSVIYIAPVLNEYLYNMASLVNNCIKDIEDVEVNKLYRPFNWIPHTTVAKKLSKEEMQIGFKVLQNSFGVFSGEVVKIGVAKTNPYEDIISWDL